MTRWFSILIAVFFASHGHAKNSNLFEYGPRPPLHVFDPTGTLEPRIINEISDPLQKLYEKERIDVIVVVLNDIGASPPELVAERFAEAWSQSPVHCIVLHVPGHPDSPWLIPGGKLIEQLKLEEIKKSVADAKRRISAEPNEVGKLKASATETADMLRFWIGNAINRSELIQKQSAIYRQRQEQKMRDRKLALVTTAACAIPLIFGIAFFMIFLRNRRPRIFPECTIHSRLGAPHAGGNYAVADLGPPTIE